MSKVGRSRTGSLGWDNIGSARLKIYLHEAKSITWIRIIKRNIGYDPHAHVTESDWCIPANRSVLHSQLLQ